MKRICIGLLTALGCIAVATALIARPFSKKSIQSYVLRNQDELTNYARKVIEEHPMGPLEWNGWKVYYYADDIFLVKNASRVRRLQIKICFLSDVDVLKNVWKHNINSVSMMHPMKK